ncbi:major capsid protein [Arthrobacter phage Prairie]|uniref:Major capsid protein n=1 Tax=Arthrobacter phage Prairie TaxID=2816463 RepID=A0A8A5LK76_9CAUD|nr:major capsid protein [Arthrobacter phage Prairie]
MTLTYPAQPPAVSGTKLTVDALLKAPKVLAKRIVGSNAPFLSDLVFRPDTTESGAVIYSEAGTEDLYPARGDVKQIEPGAEFPMVDTAEGDQKTAVASKFGAGYIVTDEAKDRNQLSVITKGNMKVRNALIRQDSNRLFAAFNAKAPVVPAVGVWTTPKAMRTDIVKGLARIEAYELGYTGDTVILHPDRISDLLLLDELQNLSPRENTALNPLFRRDLAGYLGVNWVSNPHADPTKAIILTNRISGVNVTEKPYGVAVVREGTRERDVVIASKRSVPVIDEPLSTLIITGIAAA